MNEEHGHEGQLKRSVSLFSITMYGIGNILGAGIYALIGNVVGETGNFSWMAFIIAAVTGGLTGLSYAELSTMFPQSAAEYVYAEKAFNKKILSFVLGWIIICTGFFSAATVALSFANYLGDLMGISSHFMNIAIAIILIVVLSLVNYIGIRESTWTNVIFTIIEAFGLIFIIAIGIPKIGSVNYFEMPPNHGLIALFSSVALIFFAYIGFEDIANIAEEVKNPGKNLSRSLLISLVVTTALYCLVSISIVGILDYDLIASSPAPLKEVATTAIGPIGGWLLSFIALFATANTVLIILIVTSRMIYGMARDNALPSSLSRVSDTRKTPTIAVFVTMAVVVGLMFLGDVKLVAEASVFGVLVIFFIVNISLIALRKNKPEIERPFKLRPSIKWVPVIALIGAAACIFVLFFTYNFWNMIIQAIMIGVGLLVYFLLKIRKKGSNYEDG
ncbi:MAG: APC family permease [Candidatus Hodarchaeota archaeon]